MLEISRIFHEKLFFLIQIKLFQLFAAHQSVGRFFCRTAAEIELLCQHVKASWILIKIVRVVGNSKSRFHRR